MQIAIKNNQALWFSIKFILLFLSFYYFNVLFFGITSPGNHYAGFLDHHLNYIRWLRWALLNTSAAILNSLGYQSIANDTELMASGHNTLKMVYTCLGLGVMSFFAAFVIAYPKKFKAKLLFLLFGLLGIQVCNMTRLVLLALYWNKHKARLIDHHVLFDIFIYIIIMIALYLWVNKRSTNINAAD